MQSLAFTTTRSTDKQRWTELEVFARPGSGYVLVTRGRSTVPGEKTLERRVPCATSAELAFALARFSAPAEALLHAAAEHDASIREVVSHIWE